MYSSIVASVLVVADDIHRHDGEARGARLHHQRSGPQIVMLAGGDTIIAESSHKDSVILAPGYRVQRAIALIVHERFAWIPASVVIAVSEGFSPDATCSDGAIPIGVLAAGSDHDRRRTDL